MHYIKWQETRQDKTSDGTWSHHPEAVVCALTQPTVTLLGEQYKNDKLVPRHKTRSHAQREAFLPLGQLPLVIVSVLSDCGESTSSQDWFAAPAAQAYTANRDPRKKHKHKRRRRCQDSQKAPLTFPFEWPVISQRPLVTAVEGLAKVSFPFSSPSNPHHHHHQQQPQLLLLVLLVPLL